METPVISTPKTELTTASTGLKFGFARPLLDNNHVETPLLSQSFSMKQSISISALDEETLEKEVMVINYMLFIFQQFQTNSA